MTPSGTRIRRLRARLPRQETPNARRTLERLLVTCDPSENLLPPGALLCIREMRDPLPGALSLTPQSLHPPARWREALDRRWQESLTHASRPFHDASAATAAAVLFADESELLACLARSAINGRLPTEWWWTSLLQPDELPDWLRRWQRRPEVLPTALERLAGDGTLAGVLRSIPEERAGTLLQILRRSHGLLHLPGTVHDTFVTGDPAEATVDAPPRSTSGNASDPHPTALPPAAGAGVAEWARLIPELADPAIPRSTRAWAAVALLLIRAPQVPRQSSFPGTLLHWLDTGLAASSPPPAERIHAGIDPVRQRAQGSSQAPFDVPSIGSERLPPEGTHSSGRGPRSAGAPNLPGNARFPRTVPTSSQEPDPTPDPNPGSFGGPVVLETTPQQGESHLTESEALPAPSQPGSFRTEFGGVFFLLNVALSLRLYADFTEPLTPGLDLSPWDLLDLLAGRCAGSRYPEDPLRLHLAAWAGRPPDTLPGSEFQPPTEPTAATPPTRHAQDPGPSNGASFPPRLPTPSWSDPGRQILGNPVLEPAHLTGWLDRLVECIESRLHRALPSWETGPHLSRLVQQPARVETFDTTVRIRFALESHPVAIRLAGLDRDPGWIPAAGRTVLFVFDTSAAASPRATSGSPNRPSTRDSHD